MLIVQQFMKYIHSTSKINILLRGSRDTKKLCGDLEECMGLLIQLSKLLPVSKEYCKTVRHYGFALFQA